LVVGAANAHGYANTNNGGSAAPRGNPVHINRIGSLYVVITTHHIERAAVDSIFQRT
jgi:hypothetical protein